MKKPKHSNQRLIHVPLDRARLSAFRDVFRFCISYPVVPLWIFGDFLAWGTRCHRGTGRRKVGQRLFPARNTVPWRWDRFLRTEREIPCKMVSFLRLSVAYLLCNQYFRGGAHASGPPGRGAGVTPGKAWQQGNVGISQKRGYKGHTYGKRRRFPVS